MPGGSSSLVNVREAEVVLSVYRELVHRHPDLRLTPAVGVISPYKAQVRGRAPQGCLAGLHVLLRCGPARAEVEDRGPLVVAALQVATRGPLWGIPHARIEIA